MLCQSGELNISVVLTNESLIKNENIELQSMNNNVVSAPTWQSLHVPPDCCPIMISKHFICCGKLIPKSVQERWTYFRSFAHYIVEHQYFESLIIISILASSTALVSFDNTRV